MIFFHSVAQVRGRIAKKYFNDDSYVSEEAAIAVQEKQCSPPVVLFGRPEAGYLHLESQRIVVK